MANEKAYSVDLASVPKMMTIREVAKTGILTEYALRQMHRQNMLPSIKVGNRVLINYDTLVAQLNNLKPQEV